MNWESIQGQWNEVKGLIRQKWGKLTNDDLKEIEGKKDCLVGKIQGYYGKKKENAESEIDGFFNELELSTKKKNPSQH